MFVLDLLENFERRLVRIDLFGGFGEFVLLLFQFLQTDLENFRGRQIDKFSFGEDAMILLFAEREIARRLWQFFALEPVRVIVQSGNGFAIHSCRMQRAIFRPSRP